MSGTKCIGRVIQPGLITRGMRILSSHLTRELYTQIEIHL